VNGLDVCGVEPDRSTDAGLSNGCEIGSGNDVAEREGNGLRLEDNGVRRSGVRADKAEVLLVEPLRGYREPLATAKKIALARVTTPAVAAASVRPSSSKITIEGMPTKSVIRSPRGIPARRRRPKKSLSIRIATPSRPGYHSTVDDASGSRTPNETRRIGGRVRG